MFPFLAGTTDSCTTSSSTCTPNGPVKVGQAIEAPLVPVRTKFYA
jgi:hypothetical protein